RGPASQSAVVSSNQAVCKVGSAVLPEVKRFLDRGLVFELELRGVEQSGNSIHDLIFLQTVSAAQHPFGLKQNQQADQHLFLGADLALDQPAGSLELGLVVAHQKPHQDIGIE